MGKQSDSSARICPSCNHSNPPDAVFCENCGLKLNVVTRIEEIPSSTQRFDPNDLYSATATIASPTAYNLSQKTTLIDPETVKIIVSLDDYRRLHIARKIEDLVVWNALSQIMLGAFFALLGVAVDRNFSELGTPFLFAFVMLGVSAAMPTIAYWLSIVLAARRKETDKLLSSSLSSQERVGG